MLKIYTKLTLGILLATLTLAKAQIPNDGPIVTNPIPSEAPTNSFLSVDEPASVHKLTLNIEQVEDEIKLSWNTVPNRRCYDLLLSTDMTNWIVFLPFPPVNTNKVSQAMKKTPMNKGFFRVRETHSIPDGFVVTKTSNLVTND